MVVLLQLAVTNAGWPSRKAIITIIGSRGTLIRIDTLSSSRQEYRNYCTALPTGRVDAAGLCRMAVGSARQMGAIGGKFVTNPADSVYRTYTQNTG